MRVRWLLGIAVSLLFLAGSGVAEPASVSVAYAAQGVAIDPADATWKQARQTTLALTPQIIVPPNGGGSVNSVNVRAMHDGEWMALRLDWADATADREVGSATFRDAAAVGFPLMQSDPLPSPFMGDTEHPVGIWQWSADLEADAHAQGGFAKRYPHTPGVWYFPQDASVHRDVQAWRGVDPVMEFVATGFGTLTRRPTSNVQAASGHAKGRWNVVLRRRLETGDPNDAAFRPGETTQLVVAIWDGDAREVNGRKAVTLNWVPLVLAPTVAGDAAD